MAWMLINHMAMPATEDGHGPRVFNYITVMPSERRVGTRDSSYVFSEAMGVAMRLDHLRGRRNAVMSSLVYTFIPWHIRASLLGRS